MTTRWLLFFVFVVFAGHGLTTAIMDRELSYPITIKKVTYTEVIPKNGSFSAELLIDRNEVCELRVVRRLFRCEPNEVPVAEMLVADDISKLPVSKDEVVHFSFPLPEGLRLGHCSYSPEVCYYGCERKANRRCLDNMTMPFQVVANL